ncbi:MAG TPA: zf-HC2 domain-containing protein [Streptosporangiaceae bacterium]|jgi:anti-sigma factor RsiW
MKDLRCDEFVELLTAYLDDALDPETTAAITRHLAGCPGCVPYLDQFLRTIKALGGLGPAPRAGATDRT